MAFANGYNGDQVSLNHILQTLEAETALVPGVIINPDLSVNATGEVAYFYKRASVAIGTGTVGGKVTESSKGATRVSINLTSALTFNDVIPAANKLMSPDAVADRTIALSISTRNKFSDLVVASIVAAAQTPTASYTLSSANIYEAITNDIKEFETANKATKMKPTGLLVGPTGKQMLLNNANFLRSTTLGDRAVADGFIGSIAGLPVVYCQAFDDNSKTYAIVNAEGIGAPINVNTFVEYDATAAGYPGGTGIAGELGYGIYAEASDNLIWAR